MLPIGLPDIGSAGDDHGSQCLIAHQGEVVRARNPLFRIVMARSTRADKHLFAMVSISDCRLQIHRNAIKLRRGWWSPVLAHASHQDIDLFVSQRAASRDRKRRHLGLRHSIADPLSERAVGNPDLVNGIRQFEGSTVLSVRSMASCAVLVVQSVKAQFLFRPLRNRIRPRPTGGLIATGDGKSQCARRQDTDSDGPHRLSSVSLEGINPGVSRPSRAIGGSIATVRIRSARATTTPATTP